MKNKIKSKRGSEIIQVLIVIAVMGGVAIATIGTLNSTLFDKSSVMINNIDYNIEGSGADVD